VYGNPVGWQSRAPTAAARTVALSLTKGEGGGRGRREEKGRKGEREGVEESERRRK
jgi:hypothetical protein